jgi:glutathione S-transferase
MENSGEPPLPAFKRTARYRAALAELADAVAQQPPTIPERLGSEDFSQWNFIIHNDFDKAFACRHRALARQLEDGWWEAVERTRSERKHAIRKNAGRKAAQTRARHKAEGW